MLRRLPLDCVTAPKALLWLVGAPVEAANPKAASASPSSTTRTWRSARISKLDLKTLRISVDFVDGRIPKQCWFAVLSFLFFCHSSSSIISHSTITDDTILL